MRMPCSSPPPSWRRRRCARSSAPSSCYHQPWSDRRRLETRGAPTVVNVGDNRPHLSGSNVIALEVRGRILEQLMCRRGGNPVRQTRVPKITAEAVGTLLKLDPQLCYGHRVRAGREGQRGLVGIRGTFDRLGDGEGGDAQRRGRRGDWGRRWPGGRRRRSARCASEREECDGDERSRLRAPTGRGTPATAPTGGRGRWHYEMTRPHSSDLLEQTHESACELEPRQRGRQWPASTRLTQPVPGAQWKLHCVT